MIVLSHHKILFIAILLVLSFSCQREKEDIVRPSTEDSFLKGSALFNAIEAVSLKDGSLDNIIDRCSCLSLVYPVSVTAYGNVILLENNDDLLKVERILDRFGDIDSLEIGYPITVLNEEHNEIQVADIGALTALKNSCVEGGLDKDNECVDIVYPITLSLYDTGFQRTRTVEMNSDAELSLLLRELTSAEYVSIAFPIQLTVADTSTVSIANNSEFELSINNMSTSCDEDDDNDFNDDDIDTTPVKLSLLNSNFNIVYFYDQTEMTSLFSNYIFHFGSGDSLLITNGVIDFTSDWNVFGDDGTLDLNIGGGLDLPLKDLTGDWDIIYAADSILELSEKASSNTVKHLIFRKTANIAKSINKIITSGTWAISQLTRDSLNNSDNFIGHTFNFHLDGSATAYDSAVTTNGTWSAFNDKGQNYLQIDFTSNAPFDLIRENWEIIFYSDTQIHLELSDGSGLTIASLSLVLI